MLNILRDLGTMTEYYKKILKDFNENIKRLKCQKRIWLMFSSLLFLSILLLTLFAEYISKIQSQTFWWSVGIFGLIILFNWWYWTITLVRRVLQYQEYVVIILNEITEDVRDLKSDITEMHKDGLIK